MTTQTQLVEKGLVTPGPTPKGPTPIAVSVENQFFNFPSKRAKCRGKHKFRNCRITFTFELEDIESPYFPVMYGMVCRKCGEIERP